MEYMRIEEYNYPLPDERIAKFPLPKRDESKLLLYRQGEISEHIFKELPSFLPKRALMVLQTGTKFRQKKNKTTQC